MKYIDQLTRFHKSIGLSGDALDAAVRRDSDRVIANVKESGCDPESFIEETDTLDMLFIWSDSNEGHDYWFDRSFNGSSLSNE